MVAGRLFVESIAGEEGGEMHLSQPYSLLTF